MHVYVHTCTHMPMSAYKCLLCSVMLTRTQVARPRPRPRTCKSDQGQGQGLGLSDQGQGQGHCDYNDQGHGQGLYNELKLIENDILIITGKVKIIYFKVVSYKHYCIL